MSLLRGITMVIVGAAILASVLNLTVLDWLLRNSFPALLIAIPIIFQPEIRRFLERVGRTGRWPWPGRSMYELVVDIVADTALSLSANRQGAIIVFEREATLEDHIETGVKLDAVPSTRLLEGIFYPNSALHDGAVIMREDRVLAASCTLPLSDRSDRWGRGWRGRGGGAFCAACCHRLDKPRGRRAGDPQHAAAQTGGLEPQRLKQLGA